MSASKLTHRVFLLCIIAALISAPLELCMGQLQPPIPTHPTQRKVERKRIRDTPETLLGERLFLEARFAQFFAAHSEGDVNRPLTQGDPLVAQFTNPRAAVPYPSPFAGKSINCRSCHLVDEFSSLIAGTNRTYADFLPRTPIPARGDGQTLTARNSRNIVDVLLPQYTAILLHGDGEFSSATTLVESTLTGRDFGWLPSEHRQAIHHIAQIIRNDDGRDALGRQYGGSYAKLMLATAPDLPEQFRLAVDFRIDVSTATDQQILHEIARIIAAYLSSLQFERTPGGIHSGSAYDMFLAKNDLPATPDPGETDAEYSQRLLQQLAQLQKPRFVQPYERWLRFHPHVLQFREQELAGLKLFLRLGTPPPQQLSANHLSPLYLLATLPLFGVLLRQRRTLRSDWITAALAVIFLCVIVVAINSPPVLRAQALSNPPTHAGNCASCHPAPEFTDFHFHNTGAAQEEFDALHGIGSFAQLTVPSYKERRRHPNRYLPATPQHPHATGIFRTVPVIANPWATDLGLWNVFANSDFPEPQSQLVRLLCGANPCDPNLQLPRTIALFRTPGLRDLGHSWPYLHTGRMATVDDVLRFYIHSSALARAGQLRNADPELTRIFLDENDIAALAAFLRSLDEDYDN